MLREIAPCKGFTLIELSIVLVITGFIAGSVLVGKDLIRAASLRDQIKQIQEYQVAFITFQTKYNCLPGDCLNARQFLGTADTFGNTINNGDGNGLIDTSSGAYYDTGTSWSGSQEIWGAFQQLAMANMISFVPRMPSSYVVGTGLPGIKLNSTSSFFLAASYNFIVQNIGRNPLITSYQNGRNALWFVDCNPAAGPNMDNWDDYCAIFKAADLQSIDQKIDDGMPLSGQLFGFGGYNTNNDCLNGVTYKTTNTTAQCQAAYVLN